MNCGYCGHDERAHDEDMGCISNDGEGCMWNCIGFMKPENDEENDWHKEGHAGS